MKYPLVINFFGGPGCGKSTTAALLYAELKIKNINCELVNEFAKDLVWQNSLDDLKNQIYVFGNQHHRMFRLIDKVDIIITDSPLLLTLAYADKDMFLSMEELVFNEHNKYNNINIFLNRNETYQENGRKEDYDNAIKLDNIIQKILKRGKIEYESWNYPIYENLNKLIEKIKNNN